MMSCALLLLATLSAALAAPAPATFDNDYPEVLIPQKRAALVLDRLLVALQKALHDEPDADRDGPRTAPLRIAHFDENGLIPVAGSGEQPGVWPPSERAPEPRPLALRLATLGDDTSALQRRGQGGGRGRVLRCYFNAITCF